MATIIHILYPQTDWTYLIILGAPSFCLFSVTAKADSVVIMCNKRIHQLGNAVVIVSLQLSAFISVLTYFTQSPGWLPYSM